MTGGTQAWRLIIVSAVLLMAASGAGCSVAAESAPVAIPADPAAAVAAAKAAQGKESARFTVDSGYPQTSYTGMADAKTRNWEITGRDFVVRRVGTDVFVTASGGTLAQMIVPPATTDHLAAGGWVRTRLPNARELSVVFHDDFPWNLAQPASRAEGMTKTGDRSLAGKLTDPATEVAVDLDERGRFARIRLDHGGTTGGATVISFADYGKPAGVTAPPAGTVVDEEENPTLLAVTGLP